MSRLVNEYLIQKTSVAHIQFFRYFFVGGFATVVDVSSFFVIGSIMSSHYLIAQTIGFILGLIANYLISVTWVFNSTGNLRREFAIFALIGLGGLLWSYLILWTLIDVMELYYFQNMLSKSVAVLLVLIWNFGMRRRFAFQEQNQNITT